MLHNSVPGFMVVCWFNLISKSFVSFRYVGILVTKFWRWKSTYLDRGSNTEPMPDTIGLPGVFTSVLCTLGNMYNTGICGKSVVRNYFVVLSIRPVEYASRTTESIIFFNFTVRSVSIGV
ncbi:hypothetical protein XELAEV_18001552mg [Xenopus laevis]|nr:hypothetical protein XELAEV_18001552mg [Xenopus laevis]